MEKADDALTTSRPISGRTTPEYLGAIENLTLEDAQVPKIVVQEQLSGADVTALPKTSLEGASEETTQGKGKLSSSSSARSLRKDSPTRLPTEFTIKCQSQVTRISCIRAITSAVPKDPSSLTLVEVETDLEQVEELHREFLATHEYFELNWPAAFLDHIHFSEGMHQQEVKGYRLAKLTLNKAKKILTQQTQAPAAHLSEETRHESKLPDISLPSFSGQYADWPNFREMFTCLILDNKRLSNVGKLHYLRSCMEASPAQLIANFPLVGTSLQPSWDLLVARYENKRLLIQAQLDQLCSLKALTAKSAKGLSQLISTVSEARKALESLGVTTNLGDVILVHHVSRHLDRTTRESWETSLGSSLEYPVFTQLEEFLNCRARALERIEATASSTHHLTTSGLKKICRCAPGIFQRHHSIATLIGSQSIPL